MSKSKYRPITVSFDLEDEWDRKTVEWLEKHKTKTDTLSNQIRKALREYIERQGNQ